MYASKSTYTNTEMYASKSMYTNNEMYASTKQMYVLAKEDSKLN